MRILLIGADGFIGRYVRSVLERDHDVVAGIWGLSNETEKELSIDLSDSSTVAKALNKSKPNIIINCAGIVGPEADTTLNMRLTLNLLKEVVAVQLELKKIIIIGSAGEYGVMKEDRLPVDEDEPLLADSGYGLSKRNEIEKAIGFADEHNLPLVVARIFNPIGAGMHPRFLISRILQQVEEVRIGEREGLEVSRLDSKRDYVDIRDVARAIKIIAERPTQSRIYNIGSGIATSNEELIKLVLAESNLPTRPNVVETGDQREPTVASQADITRISRELGWVPQYSLTDTVKEIIHGAE